jgi:hypothetical protein
MKHHTRRSLQECQSAPAAVRNLHSNSTRATARRYDGLNFLAGPVPFVVRQAFGPAQQPSSASSDRSVNVTHHATWQLRIIDRFQYAPQQARCLSRQIYATPRDSSHRHAMTLEDRAVGHPTFRPQGWMQCGWHPRHDRPENSPPSAVLARVSGR